ncbi:MAG: hypothetical protein V2A58_08720, partial [Planctomycetota bacterium]
PDKVETTFRLSPFWQRYAFSFCVDATGNEAGIVAFANSGGGGVRVDAVQLEEGALGPFAPLAPMELALRLAAQDGVPPARDPFLFPSGETVGIEVALAGEDSAQGASIDLQLVDFYGLTAALRTLPLAPDERLLALKLGPFQKGIYRALAFLKDSAGEVLARSQPSVFAVLDDVPPGEPPIRCEIPAELVDLAASDRKLALPRWDAILREALSNRQTDAHEWLISPPAASADVPASAELCAAFIERSSQVLRETDPHVVLCAPGTPFQTPRQLRWLKAFLAHAPPGSFDRLALREELVPTDRLPEESELPLSRRFEATRDWLSEFKHGKEIVLSALRPHGATFADGRTDIGDDWDACSLSSDFPDFTFDARWAGQSAVTALANGVPLLPPAKRLAGEAAPFAERTGEPTAALVALSQVRSRTCGIADAALDREVPLTRDLRAFVFKRPDGKNVLVLWARGTGMTVVKLHLDLGDAGASPIGVMGGPVAVQRSGTAVTINIDESPVFILTTASTAAIQDALGRMQSFGLSRALDLDATLRASPEGLVLDARFARTSIGAIAGKLSVKELPPGWSAPEPQPLDAFAEMSEGLVRLPLDAPGRPPGPSRIVLEIMDVWTLLARREVALLPASAPPEGARLDGDLAEWSDVQALVLNAPPGAASARLFAAHAAGRLTFAIEVTDASVVPVRSCDPASAGSAADAVEILLAGSPLAEDVTLSALRRVVVSPLGDSDHAFVIRSLEGFSPEDVDCAVLRTPVGYNVELSVALPGVPASSAGVPKVLLFDLVLHDCGGAPGERVRAISASGSGARLLTTKHFLTLLAY